MIRHSPCYSHSHILTALYRDNTMLIKFVSVKDYIKSSHILSWWITGTCFIQKIYAPSSSLLQDKYLPFSPSPLRLNIFRLFVILSLTQLYHYTPKIFLFSPTTFKYTYRVPSDELDKNIQWTSLGLLFSYTWFFIVLGSAESLTENSIDTN